MRFHDIKDKIQTGDALLYRGTSVFSRLIQWFTRSPYSHVALAVWIKPDRCEQELWVCEALEGKGVQARPLLSYLREDTKHGVAVEWFALQDAGVNRQKMASYCLGRIGQRYVSFWQFLWSFLAFPRAIRRMFGLPDNLDPDRLFCSEFYADAYLYGLTSAGRARLASQFVDPAETSPAAVAHYPWLTRQGAIEP